MANTFILIAKTELSSTNNIIQFTSIPQTYQDLFIYVSARTSGAAENTIYFPFNGQSPTQNQTARVSYGRGGAGAALATIKDGWHSIGTSMFNQTANNYAVTKYYLYRYADTSYRKTALIIGGNENNSTAIDSAYISSSSQTWNQTAAITTINITIGSDTFTAGSSAYLYGIKNS